MLTLQKDITDEVKKRKFANVCGTDFTLTGNFDDLLRLTRSWESMGPDAHFGQSAQGSRTRRYSDFEYHPRTGELKQLEHRAYMQSKENNVSVLFNMPTVTRHRVRPHRPQQTPPDFATLARAYISIAQRSRTHEPFVRLRAAKGVDLEQGQRRPLCQHQPPGVGPDA